MDDPPEQSRWREWLSLYSDAFGVIGGLVLVLGFLLWLFGLLSGGLIPVTVAATLLSVWIAGLVFVNNRDPLISLGSVWAPATPVLQPSDHLSLPSAKSTDPGSLSLDQLERVYELKKLEPNLVFAKGSLVGAHEDDQWRVIEGNNLVDNTFLTIVVDFNNRVPTNRRIGEAKNVSAKLSYTFFDGCDSFEITRGLWVREGLVNRHNTATGAGEQIKAQGDLAALAKTAADVETEADIWEPLFLNFLSLT